MSANADIDENFDPAKHVMMKEKSFSELKVGDQFPIPSRTIGDANFGAFQLASGDNHPIHYDIEYCQARGHQDLLAHGFHALIQTAPGAGMFPHVLGDRMIGFLDQSSRFLKPLYSGDTVYPMLAITDLKAQRSTAVVTLRSTIHNQRRELILEGEQRYLMRLDEDEMGK
jgi:acyl dehydratase